MKSEDYKKGFNRGYLLGALAGITSLIVGYFLGPYIM